MKTSASTGLPPLWLGLDLSTQSLTVVVLPDRPAERHVYLDSVVYTRDLPQYQTEHGMHISDGDNGERVSHLFENVRGCDMHYEGP